MAVESSPTAQNDAAPPSRLRFMLRAFRSRNYRLFFAGQIVSLIGNWMTSVATAWLVWEWTHDQFLLGLSSFASLFPTFVLAPFAGALVDRWQLRKTMVITQVLAMLQSFAMAAVAFSGAQNALFLIALNALQGFISAVDIPARQAFVVQLVEDRNDLPNAIALNSSMVNGARLIGPAIAGVLIAAFGAGTVYVIDGLTYLCVVFALLAMRITPRLMPEKHPPVLAAVIEGFKISYGFPPIRAILLLMSIVSLAGVPYMVLMPVFANDIFHGDARLLGALTGAVGVGAFFGALYLASRKSVVGISGALVTASAVFGVALIAFALSRNIYLTLLILPIAGASMIIEMAGSNTLLQTLAEDHQRGRVMAMFTVSFMGTVPIGGLICGWLSSRIGAPSTVMLGGIICIIAAVIFHFQRAKLRPMVHPIYVRRGILPEVAQGIRVASAATDKPA